MGFTAWKYFCFSENILLLTKEEWMMRRYGASDEVVFNLFYFVLMYCYLGFKPPPLS